MDISILRYLDVLIGFALVMALTSSFVTVLTQIVNTRSKTRSTILEKGIAALLKRADPSLAEHADIIAEAVVEWQPASGYAKDKRDVIVREQLIRILLEIVSDTSVSNNSTLAQAKAALAKLFSTDASILLEKIDSKVCELEVQHPELAIHVVNTQAILEANPGKFINAIMTRFDAMSESLTAVFTVNSHRVTFLISVLVALALPLDTIDLLKRLSSDDKLRNALVSEAIRDSSAHEQAERVQENQASPPDASNANAQIVDPAMIKKAWGELNDPKLNLVSRGGWSKILQFDQRSKAYYVEFIIGCFLSALLMTLGAPFWFEALKDLLKLRSSLAKTDDEARETRRTDQTTT
jgi:hypothetical protein